jgi:hypothetical protein
VLAEQRVQDRPVGGGVPDDADRGEGDEGQRQAEQQDPGRGGEAGPLGGTGAARGEHPLHQVDRHEVAQPERDDRRPVDHCAGVGGGQLLEVADAQPRGSVEAVRGGRPDHQRDDADEVDRDLRDAGVDAGEHAAGDRVEQRDRDGDQDADRVADAEEPFEQEAQGHQVAGQQHGETGDGEDRGRELDPTAEPPAEELRQGDHLGRVHPAREEQAHEQQAQGEADGQCRARPEPEGR